jgi:hypothetical protein
LQNVLGFRGKGDVEKEVGGWNTLTVTMRADVVTVRLNGMTLSRAAGLGVTKGKPQFQSEGAEVLIRKVTLTPWTDPRSATHRFRSVRAGAGTPYRTHERRMRLGPAGATAGRRVVPPS